MTKPKRTNYTALPGYVKATKDMVKKAKDSLGIPIKVRLPRCMGKAMGRVRAFEKAGDFSHSDDKHICDLCRCNFRAGFGTSHLGIGYCIVHDNSEKYKGKAEQVAQAHKVAIRQGFPDKAYAYAIAQPEAYVAEIKKASKEAGGMTDMRHDIDLIRCEIQKVLDSYKETGKFMKTVKQISGAGPTRRERFITIEADDLDKTKTLTALMRTLSKMSVDNLKLTESDVVTLDQVKIWAEGVVNIIETMAPDKAFMNDFIEKFAKCMNNVKTGRE